MSATMVTELDINMRIKGDPKFTILAGTLVTVCTITIDNGFTMIGQSACVCADNFDKNKGEELAYKDAFRQLWPLFGFLLAERLYESSLEAGQEVRA